MLKHSKVTQNKQHILLPRFSLNLWYTLYVLCEPHNNIKYYYQAMIVNFYCKWDVKVDLKSLRILKKLKSRREKYLQNHKAGMTLSNVQNWSCHNRWKLVSSCQRVIMSIFFVINETLLRKFFIITWNFSQYKGSKDEGLNLTPQIWRNRDFID